MRTITKSGVYYYATGPNGVKVLISQGLSRGWLFPSTVTFDGGRRDIGAHLVFTGPPWKYAIPQRNLLAEFLNLADTLHPTKDLAKGKAAIRAHYARLLAFARKYGPLQLRPPGATRYHSERFEAPPPPGSSWWRVCYPTNDDGLPAPTIPFSGQEPIGPHRPPAPWERWEVDVGLRSADYDELDALINLDTWCGRAAYYRVLIDTARRLHRGQTVSNQAWGIIDPPAIAVAWLQDPETHALTRAKDADRDVTRAALARWKAEGGMSDMSDNPWKRLQAGLFAVLESNPLDVPLRWSLSSDGKLVLNPVSSLSAHLSLQLLHAVGNASVDLVVCTNCGELFAPNYRRRIDRDPYCSKKECSYYAPRRAAARRWREEHPRPQEKEI